MYGKNKLFQLVFFRQISCMYHLENVSLDSFSVSLHTPIGG